MSSKKLTETKNKKNPTKQTKKAKTEKKPNMNHHCLLSHLHLRKFYSALKTNFQVNLLSDVVMMPGTEISLLLF